MFWLFSFLLPGYHRSRGENQTDPFSQLIKSPQSRGLIVQALGIVGGAALVWLIIAAILSFFNAWIVVGLAMVLGLVVFFRESQNRRRENWIQQGCCAQCGYDLRATPDLCPECGRDARQDEPIWRRMRRELEAKLLADSAKIESEAVDATPATLPESAIAPAIRVVAKNPLVDDAPIPLEGE